MEIGQRVRIGKRKGVVTAEGGDVLRGAWVAITFDDGSTVEITEYDRERRPLDTQIELDASAPIGDNAGAKADT